MRWDGDFKCQPAFQLEASAGSTSQSGRQHWVEQLVVARNLKQEAVLSQRKGSVQAFDFVVEGRVGRGRGG